MAMLPGSKAMVWVGPPLPCKPLGSRLRGAALLILPLWLKAQVLSSAKLPPASVNVPPEVAQSPPWLELARIVLARVAAPRL